MRSFSFNLPKLISRRQFHQDVSFYQTRIPLRLVLIVPFVVEVLVAAGLISYFSFRNGQQAVSDLANQLISSAGERATQGIDSHLSTLRLINHLNADALDTEPSRLQNLVYIGQHFSRQMQRFSGVESIALVNGKSHSVSVFRFGLDNTLYLGLAKPQQQPAYYTLDQEGNRIAQLPPSSATAVLLQSPESTSWREGYYFNFTAPEPTITATTPVVSAEGTLQAVLLATTSLRSLSDILQPLKASSSGQTFVVDREGHLIAASQPFKRRAKPGLPFAKDHSNWLIQQTAQFLTNQNFLASIQAEKRLNWEVSGERYFARVRPYRNVYGLDWLVVVVVPESDFMAEIYQNNQITMLMAGLTIVGVVLLGWLTSALIAKPISVLSRSSRDLALGKLDEPIQNSTCIAELEMLTDSFNQMTEHLQQSFDQVNIALQTSEEKFTKIFRTTPNAIDIVTLPEGRYLEVNDSFLRLTGYSRAEVIGRRVADLGIIASLEQLQQFHQSSLGQQALQNVEVDYWTKAGELRTALVACEVLELEGKLCLLSISKDITERKRLERALQEAQQVAHIGSWEFDMLTQTSIWSDELLRIHGLTPNHPHFKGMDALQTLHPDDRDGHYAVVLKAIAERKDYLSDVRILRPDGSIRHIEVRGRPVFDQSGNLLRLIGTVLDITERKQAEAAQRESEECFQKAFTHTAVAMAIVSTDGRFLQVNEAYSQMFGYTPSDLLPMSFQDITHPEDLPENMTLFNRALAGEITHYRMKKRYFHKDGRIIWALLSTALVRDTHHQPLYFVSHIQYITC